MISSAGWAVGLGKVKVRLPPLALTSWLEAVCRAGPVVTSLALALENPSTPPAGALWTRRTSHEILELSVRLAALHQQGRVFIIAVIDEAEDSALV